MIARTRNCIKALDSSGLIIEEDSILSTYQASLLDDSIASILKPNFLEEKMKINGTQV